MVKVKKVHFGFVVTSIILIVAILITSLFLNNSSKISQTVELTQDFNSNINKLVINEVMTSNPGVYASKNGEISDYLELYNGTNNDIDLNGYGLSDKKDEVKWAFSNITIKAKSYLVVSLSSESDENVANFKLKSSGNENIILTNNKGRIIDALQTVKLNKNEVMARDENGLWLVTNDATPGFENSKQGLQAYLDSLYSYSDELYVSEFLISNKGNFINEYNRLDGFIELYNNSNSYINLSRVHLSNNQNIPFKFQLPSVDLAPYSYYYIYTGENRNDLFNRYTGFNLDNNSGNIILSLDNKIILNYSYSNVESGMSMVKSSEGFLQTGVITPGFENSSLGCEMFQIGNMAKKNDLIINEVSNNNASYLPNNGYEFYDYVELYNNTNYSINLNEYCISNDSDNLNKYILPEVILEPNNYYIIMCSGDLNLTNTKYLHTNFKLSDRQGIYLSKNNQLVDSVFIDNSEIDVALSRSDYGFTYTSPNPKGYKKEGIRFKTIDPEIITSAGIYNDVNEVTISINSVGDTYFTLNGNDPTKNSYLYEGTFSIDESVSVKAVSYYDYQYSNTVSKSFLVNEDLELPVISITMNSYDFSNLKATDGIYQCNFEMFEKGRIISSPCGIELFGGNARSQRKQSFQLRFKKEYGASALNYQVFDDVDNALYDNLVLRCGSTDWSDAIIRDILGTSLVKTYTKVDVQAYKPCVLFFNGNYYGIYNIREKVNEKFIQYHYNVDVSDLNLLSIEGEVKAGSSAYYNELLRYIRNNNIKNEDVYQKVCEMVDIENIIDYWIAESFVSNNDVINIRFFNCSTIDDNKLKMIFYDLDYAFFNVNINYFTLYLANSSGVMGDEKTAQVENTLIRNLLKNEEFRTKFVERLSYNMLNTWNIDNINKRIDEILAQYSSEIERDRDRWDISMKHFENEIEELRNFCEKRVDVILKQAKNFFELSEEQMREYFKGLWV